MNYGAYKSIVAADNAFVCKGVLNDIKRDICVLIWYNDQKAVLPKRRECEYEKGKRK